jgi:hypothetical protein
MGKRWPLVAALAYVVPLVIGLFVMPVAPGVTASGRELVAFYRAHGDEVRLGVWVATLTVIPLALLLAHIRMRLVGLAREVMGIGSVSLIVLTCVWLWSGAGLALHADTLRPDVARTVADVSAFYGPVLTVSIALLVGAVGMAAWRGDGGLPRWLAYVSGVYAAEQLIETITVFGHEGFIAPGGDMNFGLGAGMLLIWLVAAAVATSREAPGPTRASDGDERARLTPA